MTERTSDNAWRAMHGLTFFAFMAVATFVPALHAWPLIWVVPLAAYYAVVAIARPDRATFHPSRFGRVSTPAVAATLIIAVGSSLALIAFRILVHPDVSQYSELLPTTGLGSLVLTGILFSVFNALFEEIVFRGILFDAIESQWGGWGAVAATAVLFGVGHLHGYPPGPVGAALATVYALALGWLRWFTGGIGLPVIAHIAADATIFIIVACEGVL